jgi:3-hydroxypropanoate dehydrogenase
MRLIRKVPYSATTLHLWTTSPDPLAPERLFTHARTHSTFLQREVDDALLHRLYDLVRWGPASMNCQPARWLFGRSETERARLIPLLASSNQDKVRATPVTAIIAFDNRFHEQLLSSTNSASGVHEIG